MDVSDEAVQKIQRFAEKRQDAEHENAQEALSSSALEAYTRRLDATLHELQYQVRRQEAELKNAGLCFTQKLAGNMANFPF